MCCFKLTTLLLLQLKKSSTLDYYPAKKKSRISLGRHLEVMNRKDLFDTNSLDDLATIRNTAFERSRNATLKRLRRGSINADTIDEKPIIKQDDAYVKHESAEDIVLSSANMAAVKQEEYEASTDDECLC